MVWVCLLPLLQTSFLQYSFIFIFISAICKIYEDCLVWSHLMRSWTFDGPVNMDFSGWRWSVCELPSVHLAYLFCKRRNKQATNSSIQFEARMYVYCRRHRSTRLCLVSGAKLVLHQEQTLCGVHQGIPMVVRAGILTLRDQWFH